MSVRKTLKAFGVALIGFKRGVTFNNRKGKAFFKGLSKRTARFASLCGYDVRYKRNGDVFFQLRDRKRERKVAKRIRRLFGLSHH